MAKHDCKSEPRTPQAAKKPQPRYYTVGYAPNGLRASPPMLRMSGQWLAALGFTTGQPVSVIAEHGCLVIRTVLNP